MVLNCGASTIIKTLVENQHIDKWTITSSRRTPFEMVEKLAKLTTGSVSFYSIAETPNGWLEDRLKESCEVWVTFDSMSMSYEALSSGCRVHIIEVTEGKFEDKFDKMRYFLLKYAAASPYENFNEGKNIAKKTMEVLLPSPNA